MPNWVSRRIYTYIEVYNAIQGLGSRDCAFGKGWDFAIGFGECIGSW